jgi:hypothetical protein
VVHGANERILTIEYRNNAKMYPNKPLTGTRTKVIKEDGTIGKTPIFVKLINILS